MAQKIIGFLIALLLLFVVNTVMIALVPSIATVERQYVTQTASWGASLRSQVQNNAP